MFSNDDAMVTALKAHEIDAIEIVPATAIKTLRQSGFVVSDVPGLDQTDFIINSNPKKKQHRELLNLKVKEAFDHAIDRKQIVQRRLPRRGATARLDHPRHDRRLAQPAT